MDASVIAALAKWPNVPACYGWLALDARGQWRLGAPDSSRQEVVRHTGLANFLGRNYSCTKHGEWFCQNGPQRAYVSLAATPWILHLDHDELTTRLFTHTGLTVSSPKGAHVDEAGRLFVDTEYGIGIIDDRDLSVLIRCLIRRADHGACSDALLDALGCGEPDGIALKLQDHCMSLERIESTQLEQRFSFVRAPIMPASP